MKKFAVAAVMMTLAAAPALAQSSTTLMTTLPSDATTVTNVYKQNVYDPQLNKIGAVEDVLIDKDGKIVATIIGVGGFLGAGEKDVAVPFSALHNTQRDNKWYQVVDTTKDALKNAPGYKYDRTATKWVPDNSTTGSSNK